MALREIFFDDDENQMEVYINTKGKLFIGIGERDENYNFISYISLDKEDAILLKNKIENLIDNMNTI